MIINGLNYSFADILVIPLSGIPLIGIQEISYDEEQEMEENYGAGPFPIGWGAGNFKFTAKMRLYREEILTLQAAAPFAKLSLIPPFPIKVVYGNLSQLLQIDTLVNCVFRKNGLTSTTNDKRIIIDMPLLITGIAWNGVNI